MGVPSRRTASDILAAYRKEHQPEAQRGDGGCVADEAGLGSQVRGTAAGTRREQEGICQDVEDEDGRR